MYVKGFWATFHPLPSQQNILCLLHLLYSFIVIPASKGVEYIFLHSVLIISSTHWGWGVGVGGFLFLSNCKFDSSCTSCNSKGRKGGISTRTKRWKDWYLPSNLYWWATGEAIIFSDDKWRDVLKLLRDYKNAKSEPQIWTSFMF